MDFRKQMGFRLLAGCLSVLMFLPQAFAQEAQILDDSGTISISERVQAERQETNNIDTVSKSEIEKTKKISKKNKNKNDNSIFQTTFLGTLDLVETVILFEVLRTCKGLKERLDKMERESETNSEQKRENDSSRKSSIIKKEEEEEKEEEEKEEEEKEEEEEEEEEECAVYWRKKKEQTKVADENQELVDLLSSAGLDAKYYEDFLLKRSVMRGFLNSTELKPRNYYRGYITHGGLKSDMCQHGLYAIVNYLYNNEKLGALLYCVSLFLNDIGARKEEGVTSEERQLYDRLKEVMSNVIGKDTTLQQCLNNICRFLRKEHDKVKNSTCLTGEILEKWRFIANSITHGADKIGDSIQ